MKRFVLLCTVVIAFYSQGQNDPVLMTLEGDSIYLSEFEHVYNKNRNTPTAEVKTPEEYLELFINFKLKVKAAEDAGLDTLPRFERELNGYREDLARPYLSDSEVTEALVAEAFERLQYEVSAKHILFKLDKTATPEDTLRAYQNAMAVLDKIEKGASFTDMAVEFSADPSAKDNLGDLGYFSALYMVYPFETAAYTTPVGEVSMPIRTRFGYHLIQVTDKRPARGEVKVAHILVKIAPEADSLMIFNAEKKANEVLDKALAGEPFRILASQYSDDKTTGPSGGDLPWFGSGVMVDSFDEAAFSLDTIGEIGGPFRTEFGFHIIKLVDKKGPPSREQNDYEIRRKIKGDSRSEKSEQTVLDRLEKVYQPTVYEENVLGLSKALDVKIKQKRWKPEVAKGMSKPVLVIADRTLSQYDFAIFLGRYQYTEVVYDEYDRTLLAAFDQFFDKELLAYENDHLETNHEEFRLLMKEYRDGILLFELMDDEVWSKAMRDSAGLADFYEANKMNYMWPERVKAKVHTATDPAVATKIYKYLGKGKTAEWISDKLNAKSNLAYQFEEGVYTRESFPAKSLPWTVGLSEVQETARGYQVFEIEEVLVPEPKALSEARGIIISDYQRQLEKDWIVKLRDEYEYTVYSKVLEQVK